METFPDSESDEDKGMIRCFQHCDANTNILCFSQIPLICPICRQDVTKTESLIPPFRLPSPLTNATENPFSVVMRPTVGNFLEDYQNSANLHIGLTNSKGIVYDFDEGGVHIGSSSWNLCVAASLINHITSQTAELWDVLLDKYAKKSDWSSHRYEEQEHNCFTFVMRFFQFSKLVNAIPAARSRKEFITEFLLPHTQKTSKYIAMYRQIAAHGFLCQPVHCPD